jgi:hypothetical protein
MASQEELRLRGLSFGEFYYMLRTKYRKYVYTHLFVVFQRSSNKISLHVPRNIFNKCGENHSCNLCVLPIVIIDRMRFEKTKDPMDDIRHYNILIIDYNTKCVERFEPADSKSYTDLDNLLKRCFNDYGYKYKWSTYIGPQYNEICEIGSVTMNCGYWALMYIQDRTFSIYNHGYNLQTRFIKNWMYDISKRGYYKTLCDYKSQLIYSFDKNRDVVMKYNDLVFSNIFWRKPLDYYDYTIC